MNDPYPCIAEPLQIVAALTAINFRAPGACYHNNIVPVCCQDRPGMNGARKTYDVMISPEMGTGTLAAI